MIPRIIRKVLEDKAEVLLLAPHWPRRLWILFLSQGAVVHPEPQWLKLTIWHLSREP